MDAVEILRQHGSRASRELDLADPPPFFVQGRGATLFDKTGKDYIDFASGTAVSNSGHGNQAVMDAIIAQVQTGVLHTGSFAPNEPKARLIEQIMRVAPSGLERVHLASAGGEAVEAALKAVRYATGRHNVIAFWGAYHGRPTGALAMTSFRSYRDPFLPVSTGVHHFAYPYPYRNPFGLTPGQLPELLSASLSYLDAALGDPASGLGPIAAIFVEPIQGVGGIVVPPDGFMRGLREMCDRYGILLVADEIFCGFGRTGNWFGSDRDGVSPDVMVVSKGLGGGLPVAGIVGTEAVLGTWAGGMQSSTYEGNPVACAAGAASINFLIESNILVNVRAIETRIRDWAARISSHPYVGDVRGCGAMWGIELVEPGSRTPATDVAKDVRRKCVSKGVIVHRNGHSDNVLALLPPLVATADEIELGLSRVEEVLATIAVPTPIS